MADIRLSRIMRTYSIGLDRLVDVLHRGGYNVDANPNAKVSDECLGFLEKSISLDLDFSTGNTLGASSYPAQDVTILYRDDLGRIITDGFSVPEVGAFRYGLLTAQSVSYMGLPIPFDRANDLLKRYAIPGQAISVRFHHDLGNQCALLSLDSSSLCSVENESYFKEGIKKGDIYTVKVSGETPNYYFVDIENTDLKGVIAKDSIPIGNDIEYLQLSHKGISPLDYSSFEWPNVIKDVDAPYADSIAGAFLGDAAMSAITEQDLRLVKELLKTKPGLKREETDTLSDIDLFINLGDNWIAFENNVDKIKGKNFWVAVDTHEKKQGIVEPKLYLFHEKPTIILEVSLSDTFGFFISKIATEENNGSDAQWLIHLFNRKASLKISSKHLHFIQRNEVPPTDYDFNKTFDIISRLDEFNSVIWPSINDVITNRLIENAHDYSILEDFLRFQCIRARKACGESVYLSSKRIRAASGDSLIKNSGPTISFPLDEEDAKILIGDAESSTENGIYVNIVDDEDKDVYGSTGVLSYRSGSYVCTFKNPNINIEDFYSQGIALRRSSNSKHLDIQAKAINGFLRKPDGIFHDLVLGRIATPDEKRYVDIEYYNPKFLEQEKGSHQCSAVKKALGNKNIVLIQGPPGTGKTTIIVEIIKHLAKEGKKVLVCSQAHAAVANIRERFNLKKDKIKILRIDDEGDVESWAEDFHPEELHLFLDNNRSLVERISSDNPDISLLLNEIKLYDYGTKERTVEYNEMHRYVVNNHDVIGKIKKERILELFPRLLDVPANLSERLLEAQLYQSMDVIMGTCIGIGMNSVFNSNSVHFDTVIIDEAAKANMAEALVPMRFGDRFVLVGDHNQLPPYVESEQIEDFVEYQQELHDDSEDDNESRVPGVEETYTALSNSVFAYFFNHPNFPTENKVTLNYQYRMHPDIGDYISKLFYNGKLHSGKGTEKNVLPVPGYPDAVTFIDTARSENNYERKSPDFSYYNQSEANIICDSLIPRLAPILAQDSQLRLGIITPYKAQFRFLRDTLSGSGFEHFVFTIDSIQGSEFDVVVFSFVRSFPVWSKNKVGFIDDMRRLNVSLSRAKKKLFLVGNSRTLLNEDAHMHNVLNNTVKPIDVFKKICSNTERISNTDDLALFLQKAPSKGTVFSNCTYRDLDKYLLIDILLDNKVFRFPISKPNNNLPETIDVIYKGCDTGKPQFTISYYQLFKANHKTEELISAIVSKVVSPDEEHQSFSVYVNTEGIRGRINLKKCDFKVGDSIQLVVRAFNDDKYQVKFSEPFSQQMTVLDKPVYPNVRIRNNAGQHFNISIGKNWHYVLIGQSYEVGVSLKGKMFINLSRQFDAFMGTHLLGSIFSGIVSSEDQYNYYINVGGIICSINKKACRGKRLIIGDAYPFKIFRGDERSYEIVLSICR